MRLCEWAVARCMYRKHRHLKETPSLSVCQLLAHSVDASLQENHIMSHIVIVHKSMVDCIHLLFELL